MEPWGRTAVRPYYIGYGEYVDRAGFMREETKQRVDGEALRRAMRRVASPVTVVTTAADGLKRGITIGSFTSLSLDPPLVCFNVQREAQMHPLVTDIDRFVVHILSDEQAHLANHFALPDLSGEEQFEKVAYHEDEHGLPVLEDVVTVLHCAAHATFEAGDHTIVVGRVVDLAVAPEGEAVIYYDRTYRRVGSEVRSSLLEPVNRSSSSTS